ncbi:MAG: LysM peptidoglycan-binding domain-containing protein [Nocardioidaceae bacterium]|nr:LysM peptidoglycan-binding domain-containing protein [Nocardioidaceae bacterium]MCL2613331.1 LysM peptidoglycan-binding domain-containing protein [Nocardioidaceae bacterium]
MNVHRLSSPLLRALTLWSATALGLVCLVRLGVPAVLAAAMTARSGDTADFAQLLVGACALVAVGSAGALLLTTTGVVVDLLTDRAPRTGGPLRRLVLAACGVAVIATIGAPAHASPPGSGPQSVIAGLPLPDRASGGPGGTARVDPTLAGGHARVLRGDSLWSIARQRLGPSASDADVATYSRRIYAANAGRIGHDPDRIVPGQLLQLPPVR